MTRTVPDRGSRSVEFCARILRALADDTRLAAVRALMGGPKHVQEINRSLRIEQSLLSHHLRVLREAGVVEAERDGKSMLYRLALQARESDDALELGCCRIRFAGRDRTS